jgi:hypothetical protein
MSAPGNEKTSLAGLVSSENTFSANHAVNFCEKQPIKPEIDLASWAALGGSVKPSRSERKPKRTWKRRAG